MSFLYGAFLFGAAAIAAPILFHLIRRTPKGRYEFSSLMFLKPSPPKLTRRSRLDQWLLLLLRSLAILLLAIAFMRPYFLAQADLSLDDAPQRQIAILLDRSASMQRGTVWEEAVGEAESLLNDLESTDEVSLFVFDETLETIVAPENLDGLERQQRRDMVREKLEELSPTWGVGDLGSALLEVAERMVAADDLRQSHAALQIVLIGDLQSGSRLDALQRSQWPENVYVDVRSVAPAEESNARLQLIEAREEESDDDPTPRVRVKNMESSSVEQFEVVWSDGVQDRSRPVPFYVPPGESRVLGVPYDLTGSPPDRLQLRGDGPGMEFDDTFYVVPPIQEQVTIAYFGSDADDDPEQMRFYLSRAFGETRDRKVEIESVAADAVPDWEFDTVPRFAVITEAISKSQQQAVDRYLERGGHALVVLQNDEMVGELGSWMGNIKLEPVDEQEESETENYAMLGEIDFRHPLFVPFAGARYNDFTKIRFWRHRRVNLDDVEEATVLARFEDRTPALWSIQRGRGTLYGMSSGWSRDDSQLALSTKFVPLLSRWLELAAGEGLTSESYVVNQPVPLPEGFEERRVRTPDGTEINLTPQTKFFTETTLPGIYTLISEGQETRFAVNLADSESETPPLGIERLEQFDIAVGTVPTQAEELQKMRQLRDTELEQRQKIWKWLIVVVLVLLGVETLLAARKSRQPTQEMGDFA
ncbi:MAG: BatA domain-containing protein [Planctomycetaceae bacterium]|nr:BatA domain-containing protein [Planctomycetaceae bacterium]